MSVIFILVIYGDIYILIWYCDLNSYFPSNQEGQISFHIRILIIRWLSALQISINCRIALKTVSEWLSFIELYKAPNKF